jgi:hypothetical protein
VHPDDDAAARERRRRSRREWADALSDEQDRRDWAFRLRSWERHPVLAGLWAACVVAAAVLAIVARSDSGPDGLGWLVPALIAGSFVFWVMLIRRDED